jgi:hypothetical protein
MDLREVGWGRRLDRSCSGQGQVVGCCEYDDEPSGSIKCGEFLEHAVATVLTEDRTDHL